MVTVDVDWAIDETIEPDCDETVHCEPDDVTVTPSTILLLTDVCCRICSGSVCCNKSVWAGWKIIHKIKIIKKQKNKN